MKKAALILIPILISLTGCQNENSGIFSIDKQTPEENSSKELISIDDSSSSLDINSSIDEITNSDDKTYETFIKLPTIEVEVGERYYFKGLLSSLDGVKISSNDENIVIYNERHLEGINEGVTDVILEYEGKYQKVPVTVHETGHFSDNFAFNRQHLYKKNIIAIGDSVTAQATVGNSVSTYVTLFANRYEAEVYGNFAIGGTTATYMYKGSNIYKEYSNNKTAIDGCRVVRGLADKDELYYIDYAFIAFGHNDRYFQPPISTEGDDVYCIDDTYSSCKSFKGSYRYMINVLRHENPNMRIILLNCTYSEYLNYTYGTKYSYEDYRNAIHEIAIEMKCRYIDPWDYMKDYYDNGNGNVYYKDTVHLTGKGHQVLADFICRN